MSYGHCIVLPNQNRDTVQIISVQDKAAVQEYKAWETTWHNRYVHACFFNSLLLSIALLISISIVYTVDFSYHAHY